ncbi:hypothetical protein [Caldovatus aquaticus]|uniref:Uncharacterized protein n=1 Tax=Caldovatus aquaticus TaxID=2865671 RepID=A0ABS7F3X3_9PROT|nr:hypothetical protein [Caldovatus aquaticus]MBW8269500.1 hypothetical protein [Caldovatus aquaticus]
MLARTAMTPASLARLLRHHGWRVSAPAARAWAAGTARRAPPAELLAWLRGLADHLRRDPLPRCGPAAGSSPGPRPPGELVDWLRRLVAYHHRHPPPSPPAGWRPPAAALPPRGRRVH